MLRRNPYIAATLGVLIPGLGHLYVGQFFRIFVAAAIVHIVIAALGALGYLSTYFGGLTYVALLALLIPFGMVDSYMIAKRREASVLKWYNRWYCYIGFIAIPLIAIQGHKLLREPILGFDFSRIKNGAVPPVVGEFDIILVDTRVFKRQLPRVGEIVLVRRQDSGLVFIGRVTKPSSNATFSYKVGSEHVEHTNVPLNAIVGKPTYVFYSPIPNRAGMQVY